MSVSFFLLIDFGAPIHLEIGRSRTLCGDMPGTVRAFLPEAATCIECLEKACEHGMPDAVRRLDDVLGGAS